MRYRHKLKQRALAILGGKCVRCGFDDPRALQIDHINGKEIGKSRLADIATIEREIINYPLAAKEKYQILCSNCNWIKRAERDETRGPQRLYEK